MKKTTSAVISFFVFLTLACTNNAASQNQNLAARNIDSQKIENAADSQKETGDDQNKNQNDDLKKQIEQIIKAANGRVGVSAVVLETGEKFSLDGKGHFPMQSVYKFPIAMAVLRQIDGGKFSLDQKISVEKSDFVKKTMRSPLRDANPNGVETSVEELIRLAVSESDGTASDVLLKLVNADAVGDFLKEIKVDEIIIVNTEKEMGADWNLQYKNWASPDGAVELLRALHERRGLSEASQSLLIRFLIETTTGPKRLKGLLPTGTIVAHKTGTSGSRDGITSATNDIGIINLPNGKHLAVAVFVADSKADEKAREETIARIAKAFWDKWSDAK